MTKKLALLLTPLLLAAWLSHAAAAAPDVHSHRHAPANKGDVRQFQSETGTRQQAPDPRAAPAPSSPQAGRLLLTGVQFVDNKTGWTLGTPSGNDKDTRIWHTRDAGSHWRSSAVPGVQNATFSFGDAKHGFLVGLQDCGEQSGQTVCGRFSILHSADAGSTWEKQITEAYVDANAAGTEVRALNANHVIVRAGSRILHSHDMGRRWMDVSIPDKQASPYRISFLNPQTGYAVGRIGSACPARGAVPSTPNADCRTAIWQTKDGGSHWTLLPSAPRLNGEWSPVDIQFTDLKHGFALFANPDTHGSQLYATEDGGAAWKLRNDKLPGIRPYPVKLDFANVAVGWIPLSVGAGPVEGGLMRTGDGGVTFSKAPDARLVSIEDSDLISPREGWVIALDPDHPEGRLLLHTGDGGAVWHDRTPML
ncbi:WD40/YVTN/BNR-like repeat-containing protein [Cohnella nanjingensis]|uniref:Photosynthesis system II assembly factor Ycf48/Hcf136-like domain-containing protein n=1 Tax=Cohnella nanjingensis TaxID=1387779 RepID=A0A7X0VI29_9BACL|nr:hypothetical protein [Cohnella nanjingensis]MBB6674770.1 hypothetical protein [Cohnella nanjingensis]